MTRADGLLAILHEGVRDARRLRDRAEEEGDLRCAVMSVKTLCDIVEKLVSVAERLAEAKDGKAVDLVGSEEWHVLRERLWQALEPFPEALAAVREVCQEVDRGDLHEEVIVMMTLPSPEA